jgi:hypothetical protein
MQVSYKNGGLAENWCALMACILNPKLSSAQALTKLGVGSKEPGKTAPHKKKKIIASIQDIRADYEKGMTILELKIKYNMTNSTISNAIKAAGGTIRTRGRLSGEKKNRTSLSN